MCTPQIGAVNCVLVGANTKGINTDWIGYMGSIKNTKIKKSGKILILGFGGAAQAIFYGFSKKKYKNIIVFNRSRKAIKTSGATNKANVPILEYQYNLVIFPLFRLIRVMLLFSLISACPLGA